MYCFLFPTYIKYISLELYYLNADTSTHSTVYTDSL